VVWSETNSRRVEEAMQQIERKATIPAWLFAYDLLVANPVPKEIPAKFVHQSDRKLLEALRKELYQE
jgi:hypothetical protein